MVAAAGKNIGPLAVSCAVVVVPLPLLMRCALPLGDSRLPNGEVNASALIMVPLPQRCNPASTVDGCPETISVVGGDRCSCSNCASDIVEPQLRFPA